MEYEDFPAQGGIRKMKYQAGDISLGPSWDWLLQWETLEDERRVVEKALGPIPYSAHDPWHGLKSSHGRGGFGPRQETPRSMLSDQIQQGLMQLHLEDYTRQQIILLGTVWGVTKDLEEVSVDTIMELLHHRIGYHPYTPKQIGWAFDQFLELGWLEEGDD